MKYFSKIDSLNELKSEYRRLAMENHPDRGGKLEAMQEINTEFETLFLILKKKGSTRGGSFWSGFGGEENTTAAEFRNQFYTQNGWAGARYNPRLRLRDIAPIVRGYVKDVYPAWKFSVTQEHYSALYVCLMEAPAPITTDDRLRAFAKKTVFKSHYRGTEEEAFEYYRREFGKGHLQQWEWYYDALTDVARKVLTDVKELVDSYRMDDSDAMVDYYDTNFYASYYIGKWDKPLKIVPKRERIQTSTGPENAKRITV